MMEHFFTHQMHYFPRLFADSKNKSYCCSGIATKILRMAKIKVQDTEITVISFEEKDYISLTDMVKHIENGLALIEKWLRNKNTIEFLGIWEEMYNPNFNSPEFEGIKQALSMPTRRMYSTLQCLA